MTHSSNWPEPQVRGSYHIDGVIAAETLKARHFNTRRRPTLLESAADGVAYVLVDIRLPARVHPRQDDDYALMTGIG